MPSIYLASTSPARLSVLRAAGIEPVVMPSHVDEDALVAAQPQQPSTTELVQLLARAKAEAIAGDSAIDGFIIGGDSNFEFHGTSYGKPHTPEAASRRIAAMSGDCGLLFSGTWVIDHRGGTARAAAGGVAHATVNFSKMTTQEIDAYVATGEPLEVAGSFTLDGLGSAFVESIDGDPSCVIGLSIPLLRTLTTQLGASWPEFWNAQTPVI